MISGESVCVALAVIFTPIICLAMLILACTLPYWFFGALLLWLPFHYWQKRNRVLQHAWKIAPNGRGWQNTAVVFPGGRSQGGTISGLLCWYGFWRNFWFTVQALVIFGYLRAFLEG